MCGCLRASRQGAEHRRGRQARRRQGRGRRRCRSGGRASGRCGGDGCSRGEGCGRGAVPRRRVPWPRARSGPATKARSGATGPDPPALASRRRKRRGERRKHVARSGRRGRRRERQPEPQGPPGAAGSLRQGQRRGGAGRQAWPGPRPGRRCRTWPTRWLCISCGAAAPHGRQLAEQLRRRGSPGSGRWHRVGGCRRAERQRSRPRPRRRSWSKQTVSGCGSWFSQSLDGEGLKPKLASYWCDSSDTCGVYATVTEAKAFGDRSLESVG